MGMLEQVIQSGMGDGNNPCHQEVISEGGTEMGQKQGLAFSLSVSHLVHRTVTAREITRNRSKLDWEPVISLLLYSSPSLFSVPLPFFLLPLFYHL